MVWNDREPEADWGRGEAFVVVVVEVIRRNLDVIAFGFELLPASRVSRSVALTHQFTVFR